MIFGLSGWCRRLLLVSSVVSLAALQAEPGQPGTMASAVPSESCTRLTATGNPEYPPYLWQEPGSRRGLIGANKTIMEALSERLGIPIEVIYTGPWSRAQEEVRVGRVDLIAGAFFTLPRLAYMDYIEPAFLTTRSVVWKRSLVAFDYSEWVDLQPYEGATVINNSFGQNFDEYASTNLSIDNVTSLPQAFRMLAQGRVDYVLYEEYPGLAYAAELDLDYVIEQIEPPISAEGLFLTISRRSPCNTEALRAELTRIMANLVADGTAQRALSDGLETWSMSSP
ncbi:MAG: transporter substrate-binding domain-containing protein [Saccharospirillum sp.]|uniref:substrate-binding periplasmic protein n=1 Tax=Saccharospirillum sp. TaxID=2033801 RepID=UPI0034A06D6A